MFPEISLNVLDIAENSVHANASRIEISIEIQHKEHRMIFQIKDNGCGMSKEVADAVQNPFVTTRTTRKVGLGIPFLKESAECTGGTFALESEPGKGTVIIAVYHTDHIDCMPLGDINATIFSLITLHEDIAFVYRYHVDDAEFILDTAQMREIVGDVSFQEPDISDFIRQYLNENKLEVDGGGK